MTRKKADTASAILREILKDLAIGTCSCVGFYISGKRQFCYSCRARRYLATKRGKP